MREQTARTVRRMIIGLGSLLSLIALVLIVLGIGPLASRSLLVIGGTGIVLVLAGLLGARSTTLYRTGAVLILNTTLLCLGLEAVALVINDAVDIEGHEGTYLYDVDKQAAQPYYKNQTWGKTLWDEFQLVIDYYPYVMWRRAPFAGETINVTAERTRLTPGAECHDEAFTVFMFGGSGMWGTGAPDWATIPAYVQAALADQHDDPVCVVNFGESGYVTTQDVIMFLLQLQRGNVPDVAFFYNGPNDLIAAAADTQPATHQNYRDIMQRIESPDLVSLSQSELMILMAHVFAPEIPPTDDLDLGATGLTLAEEVVATTMANIDLARALGDNYGVQVHFFWQPMVAAGNKPLTPEEQQMRDEIFTFEIAEQEFITAVYAAAEATAAEHEYFTSLTHVFDGISQLVYIDMIHITPEGNQMIADAMLNVLK